MTGTHHPRKLVEDKDFVVLNKSVKIAVPGGIRASQRLWWVWLADGNVEVAICATCFAYTSERPPSVVAHLGGHSPLKHARNATMKQQAAAFQLLPEAVQKKLLKQLEQDSSTS